MTVQSSASAVPLPSDVALKRPVRSAIGIISANTLEVFDFSVYAYFAVMIGRTFFPAKDQITEVLTAFAVFGVGFLSRPLGAILLGAYADRAGRKAALLVTIVLMGIGTGLLAFTPSYASIGIFAPILIVLSRLIQGFAAGGEAGPATTYLIEAAPNGKRGKYGIWQSASQGIAGILAAGIGVLVAELVAPKQLQEWGWRIPFIAGVALIVPLGLYLRRALPETMQKAHSTSKAVLRDVFKNHRGTMGLIILMLMGPAITIYVIGKYMTTYAITVLHLPTTLALSSGVAAGCASIIAALLGGFLSDRFGRKRFILWPRLLLAILCYPAFLFIVDAGTAFALISTVMVLQFLTSSSGSVILVWIPECFPRAVRSVGLSITYGIAVTLFGGTSQFVVTWLLDVTKDPLSPAWYLAGANLISVIATFFATELHPNKALD